MSYKESIEKLLEGIKEDYAGWGSNPNDLDESSKKIKLKISINELHFTKITNL